MNESDPRSNVHYMSSSENKAWKEKKTFAYKIEIKKEIKKREETKSLSLYWFQINP